MPNSENALVVIPELIIHDGKFWHKNCPCGTGPLGYGILAEPEEDGEPAECVDCHVDIPAGTIALGEAIHRGDEITVDGEVKCFLCSATSRDAESAQEHFDLIHRKH